jgi:hypothetical protein
MLLTLAAAGGTLVARRRRTGHSAIDHSTIDHSTIDHGGDQNISTQS